MTTATMKTVILDVPVTSVYDEMPLQHLDKGEYILRRIVPLDDLYSTIQGKVVPFSQQNTSYELLLSHRVRCQRLCYRCKTIAFRYSLEPIEKDSRGNRAVLCLVQICVINLALALGHSRESRKWFRFMRIEAVVMYSGHRKEHVYTRQL